MPILLLGLGAASPARAAGHLPVQSGITNQGSPVELPPPDPDDTSPEDPSPLAGLSPASSARLLLPDLRTLPPHDLRIVTLPDGTRELRLSNTIWNSGSGVLELAGEFNPVTRRTRVRQHVQALAGSPLEHLVGEFIWHPRHDHWHFEEFSVYELWTLTPLGNLGALVSSSGKLSYCLIDTDIIDRQNSRFEPRRSFYGCGRGKQGLSAGWGDTYKSYLDGQSIPLAGVSDGFYALRSIANPHAILLEADFHNNASQIYLVIRGESVEILTPAELAGRRCQEAGRC